MENDTTQGWSDYVINSNVAAVTTSSWTTTNGINTSYLYNHYSSSSTPTTNFSNSGKLTLSGNDADIVINGKSLTTLLSGIEKRLGILQPDEKLLEQYNALQQAYDHYILLESLLYNSQDENK